MNKYKLFGLGVSVAFLFAACTVGDTEKGSNEVSLFEELPECTVEKTFSGESFIDQKIYVSEEDEYYLCTKEGWVISDSSEPVVVAVDSVHYALENGVVKGLAKLAGAFEFGSPVKLSEVNFKKTPDSTQFIVTENQYTDEISSKWGDFVISKVSVEKNYALIEVTGLYQDIFTGELSEDSLTLSALVDVNSDSAIQVNLGTTLAFARAKKLIQGGYLAEAALAQAEKELKNVFGISSDDEMESAMLALVVLFHQLGSESDLVESINAFAEDFAEDGLWDDEDARVAMADFAFNVENLKIIDEETKDVILKNSDIRRNLEKFGFVEAAAFESFINKFWVMGYGLGGCGVARNNAVRKNIADQSDSADAYFTCVENAWRVATDFERDTVNLGNAFDGALKEGNVDSEKMYVYDTTGIGVGSPVRWRDIDLSNPSDSMILVFEAACTDDEEDTKGSIKSSADDDDNDHYWACNNRSWFETTEATFKIGYLCDSTHKNSVVLLKGKTEEKNEYYKCSVTETYSTWVGSSSIAYLTQEMECDSSLQKASDKKFYTCTDYENKTFREATELEKDLSISCSALTIGMSLKGESGSAKGKNYTCGCMDYSIDPLNPLLLTDVSECGYNPITWTEIPAE